MLPFLLVITLLARGTAVGSTNSQNTQSAGSNAAPNTFIPGTVTPGASLVLTNGYLLPVANSAVPGAGVANDNGIPSGLNNSGIPSGINNSGIPSGFNNVGIPSGPNGNGASGFSAVKTNGVSTRVGPANSQKTQSAGANGGSNASIAGPGTPGVSLVLTNGYLLPVASNAVADARPAGNNVISNANGSNGIPGGSNSREITGFVAFRNNGVPAKQVNTGAPGAAMTNASGRDPDQFRGKRLDNGRATGPEVKVVQPAPAYSGPFVPPPSVR